MFLISFRVCLLCLCSSFNYRSPYFMSLSMSERAGGWDLVGFESLAPFWVFLWWLLSPKKSLTSVIWNFMSSQTSSKITRNWTQSLFFSVWYSSFLPLHTMVGETVGITGFALLKPTHCSGPLLTKSIGMSKQQWATHSYAESWYRLIICIRVCRVSIQLKLSVMST